MSDQLASDRALVRWCPMARLSRLAASVLLSIAACGPGGAGLDEVGESTSSEGGSSESTSETSSESSSSETSSDSTGGEQPCWTTQTLSGEPRALAGDARDALLITTSLGLHRRDGDALPLLSALPCLDAIAASTLGSAFIAPTEGGCGGLPSNQLHRLEGDVLDAWPLELGPSKLVDAMIGSAEGEAWAILTLWPPMAPELAHFDGAAWQDIDLEFELGFATARPEHVFVDGQRTYFVSDTAILVVEGSSWSQLGEIPDLPGERLVAHLGGERFFVFAEDNSLGTTTWQAFWWDGTTTWVEQDIPLASVSGRAGTLWGLIPEFDPATDTSQHELVFGAAPDEWQPALAMPEIVTATLEQPRVHALSDGLVILSPLAGDTLLASAPYECLAP